MSSIIIRNSTISGLHATKCSSNPEVTLLVCPDTTWKDSNAMKVVVPHLENLPLDSHDLVTWPKNHARKRFVDQKIRDVAGKKVGNVPANLCGVFKDLLDEGIATRITARSTAMKPRVSTRPCTQQSFQKRPGLDRRGGGVVLDCIYIVHVHVTSCRSAAVRRLEDITEIGGDERLDGWMGGQETVSRQSQLQGQRQSQHHYQQQQQQQQHQQQTTATTTTRKKNRTTIAAGTTSEEETYTE